MELYSVDGKTIFRHLSPKDGATYVAGGPFVSHDVIGYVSIPVPEDEAARDRLFNHGDITGLSLIPHTKEEYEAQ